MKRHKVYCAGCANLFLVKGYAPLCVATAQFVEGPIRDKIDVVDVVPAERRNIKNDCGYRERVSLRAWELKRWLLWRINDGNEGRVKEIPVRDYPVKREHERKKRFSDYEGAYAEDFFDEDSLTDEEEPTEGEEEPVEDEGSVGTEIEEDVRLDGGTDGVDEPGSTDKERGEDVPNS